MATAEQPWSRHVIDNTSRGADGVRLADFNADGRLDITTGWEEGGVVRLYLQPPPDAVKKPWPRVTVGKVNSAEDAVPVDLDGDGSLDILSACEGKARTLFVHWGPRDKTKLLDAAAWKTEALPASANKHAWMFVLPMQVDGQYGVDLVVGSKGKGGGVGCFYAPKNPRDLAAWKFELAHEMGWIMSLQSHDMNDDGADDVLLSNRRVPNRGVAWLQNPGQPAALEDWPRREIGGADHEVKFLARGELTGDQRPDVLVALQGSSLQLFTAPEKLSAKPWNAQEIPLPKTAGGGKGVAIGDINLDGRNDIVFSCEGAVGEKSGVRWMQFDEAKSAWNDHEISGPEGVKFDRIELLDLDADGDLDVITCEERANLGVVWYENPTR